MTLFTEKYRPSSRADIVGNKDEIERLFSMVNSGKLCHIILEGPAGTGKTSTALVIAKQLFGEWYRSNFLELNASDERGIDIVRDTIKQFAKMIPLNAAQKIILLDEGDEMTPEAQNALRRTMEKYSDICIFIFAANNIEKLIDPIKSRCEVFHFGPLSVEDVTKRLLQVYDAETKSMVSSTTIVPVLAKIAEFSHGDMRRALNHLQMLLASGEPLTVERVETIRPIDYGKLIFDSLRNGRFLEARTQFFKAMELGYTPRYLISLLHNTYIQAELDSIDKANAVFELAECDYRMTQGVDKLLAFDALLLKLVKKNE